MTSPLALPHHDPSIRYVSNPHPGHQEQVDVRLLLPPEWRSHEVHIRTVIDGETSYKKPVANEKGEAVFELTCDQPVQRYRFHLGSPSGGYWLNGAGVLDWDPDDHNDFRLLPGKSAPDWVPERVWYQIFPDRFATSGQHRQDQDWIQWADWDDPINTTYPTSMTQMYGGDLDGVIQRLEHIVSLGIGGVYLTPIFPGRSNHRYDARTFDQIDPLLGGEGALLRLRDACDRAGLKLMTDLTLNHTGDAHEWFQAAQADANSVEAGFYHFIEHPDRYESWLGVSSLPKLDHRSQEMARRLYRGRQSIVGRYMDAPYNLDGWRIDVANMTGRLRDLDLNQEVARATRETFQEIGSDRWLVGEHFFDATPDTPGDGWHGAMNYSGISRPITAWLGKRGTVHGMSPGPAQDLRDGKAVARSLDVVRAAMAWAVTIGSMSLLSSHDTARWRTICESDAQAKVGFGMMLTLPGAPCFFYGDEIGLDGEDNERSREPMPWDRPGKWNQDFLSWYRTLIHMRNETTALHHGGFRWAHVDAEQLIWLRETPTERVLVRASRGAGPEATLDSSLLGSSELEPLIGDHEVSGPQLRLPGDGPAFQVWRLR